MKHSISLVIPAFNEEMRIRRTIDLARDYFESIGWTYQIILVDDGSTDKTLEIGGYGIESAYSSYPPKNRGKGWAVRQGVSMSHGEIVLIADADGSTPIENLEDLIKSLQKGYDVAFASRALEDSLIRVHQPFYREILGKVFNKFVQLFFLWGVWDSQCGFKAFRGDVARDLFSRATIDGFAFDVEILWLAKKSGYKMIEVPVTWRNDPDSRVRPVKDSLRMMWDLIKLRCGI